MGRTSIQIYTSVIEERLRAQSDATDKTAAAGNFVITPEYFHRIRQYLEPPKPDEDVWTIDTSNPEIATPRLTKPRFELCPRRRMRLKAQLPTGYGSVMSTQSSLTSQTGNN